ncbi:MAG: YdcF family protein [Oscillospiraceae bacterium]|nr:YdcF family protein [Oscillospiraceae bacterium]
MKKLLAGLLIAAVCFACVIAAGSTYTMTHDFGPGYDSAEEFRVTLVQDDPIAEITGVSVTDGRTEVGLRSLEGRGRGFVTISGPDGIQWEGRFDVHAFGVITENSFFGWTRGGRVISAGAALWLVYLLISMIREYRRDMRASLYRYRNVRDLGLILFIAGTLLGFAPGVVSCRSLFDTASVIMNATGTFSSLLLPLAFVSFVLVTLSNLQLMRREGRNWRNLLGCFLGVFVCLATVFPYVLSDYLYWHSPLDFHRETSVAMHAEMAFEAIVFTGVAYLECILAATVILAVKAARHTPPFDREYVLILGSQINKDGSLTKLLQGRTDRALEFAKMQREAGGPDPVFVPSGGQGPDEVTSEAEAMRRYLLEAGVPEERILPEDRSANTYENLRNSCALIREREGERDPKIAFSTTNYHVFRAGMLAWSQGIRAEGIGSRTKRYFWINAFVREFIATLYSERRTHFLVMGGLTVIILFITAVIYVSRVL